jgi:hypothetical protein
MRVPGWRRLERPFSGDQLDDQNDNRGQKNQVNEIPDGIDVNESQQREDQQHNKDSPEHMFSFELVYFASHAGVRLRLKIFEKSCHQAGPARRINYWRPGLEKIRTPLFAQPSHHAR